MTYRAAMNAGTRVADAAGQISPSRMHRAFSGGNGPDTYSDAFALKLRLEQLENENLALRTQVNQLIMSLSKTLLRGAVKS